MPFSALPQLTCGGVRATPVSVKKAGKKKAGNEEGEIIRRSDVAAAWREKEGESGILLRRRLSSRCYNCGLFAGYSGLVASSWRSFRILALWRRLACERYAGRPDCNRLAAHIFDREW